MPDRRANDRRATGRLPLVGVLASGRLVNLSSTGFAIESEHGLRIGEYYGFSIRSEPGGRIEPGRTFPTGLQPLHPHLRPKRFVGRVRWCSLQTTIRRTDGEVIPVFRAGIEFDPRQSKTPKDTGFIDFSLPAT